MENNQPHFSIREKSSNWAIYLDQQKKLWEREFQLGKSSPITKEAKINQHRAMAIVTKAIEVLVYRVGGTKNEINNKCNYRATRRPIWQSQ